MRRAMERLNNRMASLMTGTDHVALVVQCGDAASGVALRAIQGVDESSGSDFFFTFAHPFNQAGAYVTEVFHTFEQEHARTLKAMQEEGMSPWPDIPPGLRDASAPPVRRMRELMTFGRSLLPQGGGGLLGWVLFPLEIGNPAGWAAFGAELVHHEWPYPWCYGMRLYLRDLAGLAPLSTATAEAARVDHCLVDVGPKIIEDGLKEDAADEELPMQARIQSVLMLAGMDQSHQRYDDALNKYKLVLRYAEKTDQPALGATAINGIGETYERMGRTDVADRMYGQAMLAAGEGSAPATPVLLNALLNSGNLAFKEQRWDEAEKYFEGAEQIAGIQSSPKTRVQCVEQRGVAIYMQSRQAQALALWDAGIRSAQAGGFPDLELSMLRKLRDHHVAVKDQAALAQADQRIAATLERAGLMHGAHA